MGFQFKVTMYSAIAQIVLGSLLVIFGIADRATFSNYQSYAFYSESCTPIWMGLWIIPTGVIGMFASRGTNADNGRSSTASMGYYLCFSIFSVVFAGIIIILYTLGLVWSWAGDYKSCNNEYYSKSRQQACKTSIALAFMVNIFAVLEFGFGIFACVCICMNGGCSPSTQQQTPQMGQVIYIQTPGGPKAHIMTQGANGVPVAVPVAAPIHVNAVPQPQVHELPPPYTARIAGGGADSARAPLQKISSL